MCMLCRESMDAYYARDLQLCVCDYLYWYWHQRAGNKEQHPYHQVFSGELT